MHWVDYFLQFLGGMLAANGVPHFYHGVQGKPFPTPFAKPPGVGDSPPLVNVVWGAANFVVAGILLERHLPAGRELVVGWALVVIGFVASSLFLARYFAKVKTER